MQGEKEADTCDSESLVRSERCAFREMWHTVTQFTNGRLFVSAAGYFITFLTCAVMQVLDFMMPPLSTKEVKK